ncbi:5'-methylthioadenosine/S-adenosylhomocysteine nucleosidase [bacterium]|nr:5'-methylthioadenosine/S-adenosylhomocysteine nucleosidase [bacterium]
MRIGIMSAMENEVKPVLENLAGAEIRDKLGGMSHTGRIRNHDIVLTCSGIGKVKAAAHTQYLIDHFQIECIFLIGVAGAINPDLQIGDIIISDRAIEHDYWQDHWYQADRRLIEAAVNAGKRLRLTGRVLVGSVLTGDQPCIDMGKKSQLRQHYSGDCVEMEGAAVAHVCWMNAVPFVIIRAISDLANEKAIDAIKHSFNEVVEQPARIFMEIVNYDDLL